VTSSSAQYAWTRKIEAIEGGRATQHDEQAVTTAKKCQDVEKGPEET